MPHRSTKTIKLLCYAASTLLILMGLFHSSGVQYLSREVQNSNVSQLVKEVFPVLFLSPSLQLISLGLIGFFTSTRNGNPAVLFILSVFVLIDSVFAFWLGALLPGFVLLIPACLYAIAAWSKN